MKENSWFIEKLVEPPLSDEEAVTQKYSNYLNGHDVEVLAKWKMCVQLGSVRRNGPKSQQSLANTCTTY